jgi:hypothetical protein
MMVDKQPGCGPWSMVDHGHGWWPKLTIAGASQHGKAQKLTAEQGKRESSHRGSLPATWIGDGGMLTAMQ